MARIVETEEAPEAVGPYSQATVTDGLVFTAGQVALTPDGDDLTDQPPDRQARQCLDNLSAVLEAAGADLSDVVKTTVYLTDIEDYGTVNEAYAAYFAEAPPARSAVAVDELPVGADVEIEVVAEAD